LIAIPTLVWLLFIFGEKPVVAVLETGRPETA
jgi:hypothetical protein